MMQVKDDHMNVGTIVGGATQNSGKSAGMWATSGSDGRAVLHQSHLE